MKRVTRSTLQSETYMLSRLAWKMQIVSAEGELKGKLVERKNWDEVAREHVPHLAASDCRSRVGHLKKDVPAIVTDKRLGIKLASIHESPPEDRLVCTSTSIMLADCLTKSMNPDLLLRVLREGVCPKESSPKKR